MNSKLKAWFLPLSYRYGNYSQLHNLTHGNMSVDEYTRGFKKFLIKCDIQEREDQSIVWYLGGLEPTYSNVVELQQYTTFDEVCVLAHKIEWQRKKQTVKRDFLKPPVHNSPFTRGAGTIHKETQTPTPRTHKKPRPLTRPIHKEPKHFRSPLFPPIVLIQIRWTLEDVSSVRDSSIDAKPHGFTPKYTWSE